ncbi:MAG TPA: alpha/beta hydrolase [Candidatus Dormibacteraeota bacterium]|nr:alpha/beta hydrolase [Candidatus Dormibacteraeota bacterium]
MSQKTVDIGGPVAYTDHGGSGPPMVLVHGLGGSQQNWMLVASAIADAGYRVTTLDLAGFGATPLAGRESTLETNRRIIDGFIKYLGQGPVVLVGHSMGGLISMLEAGANPDSVSLLVLLDPAVPLAKTSPLKPLPQAWVKALAHRPRVGAALATGLAKLEGPERLIGNALRQYCFDASQLDRGLVAAMVDGERARIARGHAYVGYMQAYKSMLIRLRMVEAYDQEVVMKVKAPTLLIAGSADTLTLTEFVRRLTGVRPDWTYEEMSGVGHNPQMEAPDRFVTVLLNWLRSR